MTLERLNVLGANLPRPFAGKYASSENGCRGGRQTRRTRERSLCIFQLGSALRRSGHLAFDVRRDILRIAASSSNELAIIEDVAIVAVNSLLGYLSFYSDRCGSLPAADVQATLVISVFYIRPTG